MRRVISASAFLLLCAAPAAAQQQPDDVDRAMIKLGPVGITPSFNIHDVGRDNNIFDSDTTPVSDFTATFSPKADVVFQPRRLKFTYTEATDYVYFQKYASERGINDSSTIRAEADLGILQPYITAAGVNTKDRYDYEVDQRARHHDRTYGTGIHIKLFSRTEVALNARQVQTRFDDGTTNRGQSLPVAFDSDLDAVDGSVGVDLTPLTNVALVVSREHQHFLLAADRDGRTTRIEPRITFSPLGLLNGTATFGWRQFTPASPITRPFSGFVSEVTLGATIFDRNRLEGRLTRDLTYSYEADIPYFISTLANVSWTYLIRGPFDVKLGYTWDLMAFKGTTVTPLDSSDTFTGYNAGFGYRIHKNVRLGVNFDRAQRTSQRSTDRGYVNQRIFGSLTWEGGKQS